MAARDIMPYRAPLGGTTKVETYHLQADETFHEGEVVRLDATDGVLEIATDDPDITYHISTTGAVGVAAEPAEGMATDAAGTTNPAFADRGVWIFTLDQEWITPYFTTGDNQTDWTLDYTHGATGDAVGLMLNADGHWGISTANVNLQFRITQILDANHQPIRDLTTEATYVVFRREPTTAFVPL